MVTVDEAIIAKIDKEGNHFEILVDPDIAYDLKEGKIVSLSKMLAVNEIFEDSKKGDRSSSTKIQEAFGTTDVEKAAEQIVKNGDLQITTDFRRKKIDEKKKQIAAYISKNAINPQTRTPHPQERIINAMDQSHIHVDPFKPAEKQVEEIIEDIKEILPISFEQLTLEIEIPAQYAAKVFGLIKDMGKTEEQNWLNDGSLSMKMKIQAGLKDKIYSKLDALTQGNVKIKEK